MKKKKIKSSIIKTSIITLTVIILIIISAILYYKISLGPVGNKNEEITFNIKSGTSTKNIVDNIYNAGLLKNKYAGYIYLKIHNNLKIQAGKYKLNKGMSFKEIINVLDNGDVFDDSITLTFVEGKNVTSYAKQISQSFGYSEKDIINTWNDKNYLNELINKYWFLTNDILNDKLYIALEGYLYPDTYQFERKSSIKQITEKILNNTEKNLQNYQSLIEQSNYSVHQILSMASIIELEAVNKQDRATVSQVIYKRLSLNMTLGMDVTTYYAVKKDLTEELWENDLNVNSPYNTRVITGLPVGPICNPSANSLEAVFNPSKTNYIYFYADVKTKKVYFAETQEQFNELINKYRA